MIVKPIPVTLTEKNRIREHGDLWSVKQANNPIRPGEVLLSSVRTGHLRWWKKSSIKEFHEKLQYCLDS